jgi:hypothetical protein
MLSPSIAQVNELKPDPSGQENANKIVGTLQNYLRQSLYTNWRNLHAT